jgi:hypothetical protein
MGTDDGSAESEVLLMCAEWWGEWNDIALTVTLLNCDAQLVCELCKQQIQSGENIHVAEYYEILGYAHVTCVESYRPCSTCNGRGYLYFDQMDLRDIFFIRFDRPTETCQYCQGIGAVPVAIKGQVIKGEICK